MLNRFPLENRRPSADDTDDTLPCARCCGWHAKEGADTLCVSHARPRPTTYDWPDEVMIAATQAEFASAAHRLSRQRRGKRARDDSDDARRKCSLCSISRELGA